MLTRASQWCQGPQPGQTMERGTGTLGGLVEWLLHYSVPLGCLSPRPCQRLHIPRAPQDALCTDLIHSGGSPWCHLRVAGAVDGDTLLTLLYGSFCGRFMDSLAPCTSHKPWAFIMANLGPEGRMQQDSLGLMCSRCPQICLLVMWTQPGTPLGSGLWASPEYSAPGQVGCHPCGVQCRWKEHHGPALVGTG